ncbi:MAG TPA: DUF5671 domain-containing protein, partial [Acidimicrobiia bacterium]|nr:DUF5671 domain-containing protein [Acidimicrobiia bacterium]
AGWTLYLSLMELVFTTAFVVAAVLLVNGLISDESTSSWTGFVVFGAVVVFHEVQARATPPLSDAGELRRVFGSAIGLVTATVGLVGTLAGLIGVVLEAMNANSLDTGFHPWIAMLVVGAPVWWYRWWRPWDSEPATPRITWTVVVTTAAMAVILGSVTSIVVMILQYLLADVPPASQHFETVHVAAALAFAGFPIWLTHRRLLDHQPLGALLVYLYAIAAAGLATAVAMATALTIATFSNQLIVGGGPGDVVTFASVALAGLAVWVVFDRRASQRELEVPAPSWPRRLYTLGVGVIFGLVATGALITVIFILLRRVLAGSDSGSLIEPGAIFVYSGLAAFYLLRRYAADRSITPPPEHIAPFQVTLVCSHPGMIATKFPDQARLRVLHRGDDAGNVSDEMADEIVAAVANRPSYVWVDGDGFRLAPMRVGD